MSCRTTPEASRTFGPLEPSPGYGPAVSSGISTPHSAMARVNGGVAVAADEPVAAAEAVAVAEEVADDVEPVFPAGVQAASAAAAPPAPRNSPRDRRLIRVVRSNSSPRSWLGCGWSKSGWSGVREVVMVQGNRRRLC